MGILSTVILGAAIIVTNISLWHLIRRVDRHNELIDTLDKLDIRRSQSIRALGGIVERLEERNND